MIQSYRKFQSFSLHGLNHYCSLLKHNIQQGSSVEDTFAENFSLFVISVTLFYVMVLNYFENYSSPRPSVCLSVCLSIADVLCGCSVPKSTILIILSKLDNWTPWDVSGSKTSFLFQIRIRRHPKSLGIASRSLPMCRICVG